MSALLSPVAESSHRRHCALQPSLSRELPSSHSSPASTTPLPHRGATRPHHVPQRFSASAYSCNVHMSVSLMGSTTVALKSPQRFRSNKSMPSHGPSPVFREPSREVSTAAG